MSNLSFEDKRELNRRGRAAGLGLDLWPEVGEMEWCCDELTHSFNAYPREAPSEAEMKETCDDVLRRVSRHFDEGMELAGLRPGYPTAWSQPFMFLDPAAGMQGTPPDFSLWQVPPLDSPGWVQMKPERPPLLPRFKALFRRISPWQR